MKHESFNYTPADMAEQLTSNAHEVLGYLKAKKYITVEQHHELSAKLIISCIPNRPGFGRRILDRFFNKDSGENSWVFIVSELDTRYQPRNPKPQKPELKIVKDTE